MGKRGSDRRKQGAKRLARALMGGFGVTQNVAEHCMICSFFRKPGAGFTCKKFHITPCGVAEWRELGPQFTVCKSFEVRGGDGEK
jgi:hypothetical protein